MDENQIVSEVQRVSEPSYPPVSEAALASAEAALGFAFPSLLRRLYMSVGNGGFGPGYRVLGIEGGHKSDEGDSIGELYTVFSTSDPDDPQWEWPEGVLPFCHWGCAIYSCVDTSREAYPISWLDPHARQTRQPMAGAFLAHRPSLESWLVGWLRGEDLWAETYGAA